MDKEITILEQFSTVLLEKKQTIISIANDIKKICLTTTDHKVYKRFSKVFGVPIYNPYDFELVYSDERENIYLRCKASWEFDYEDERDLVSKTIPVTRYLPRNNRKSTP